MPSPAAPEPTTRPRQHPPEPVDPPLVSVVLPTRGRPALLQQALASIVGQDYVGPLEIIVVHDREEPDRGHLDHEEGARRPAPAARPPRWCSATSSGKPG